MDFLRLITDHESNTVICMDPLSQIESVCVKNNVRLDIYTFNYKGDACKAFVDMDLKCCIVCCALLSRTFVQDENILVRNL